MDITFGQLAEVLLPYLGRSGAGSCSLSDPTTRLKVTSLIQEYVQRSGTLRKWVLYARQKTVTLPRDLGVILKIKINDRPEPMHSKWYEFYDQVGEQEFQSCIDWKAGMIQEVNTFPTIQNIPKCGGYVLAEIGKRCKEITNQYTIIQGIDADTGEDVFSTYNNELIHGERLDLEQGVIKRSQRRFRIITNITKSETDDYVKYYFQTSKSAGLESLSLLTPRETVGSFRRANILSDKLDPINCYRITVLGRVNVRSDYHDNDLIPITDITSIETLAQAKQASANNNIQVAGFKYQLADRQIEDEKLYNETSDVSLNVDYATSPGSIDELL